MTGVARNVYLDQNQSLASGLTGESLGTSKLTKSVEVPNGYEQHAQSRQLPNESRRGSVNWEKKVATGKTKYISVKEAIMLSSGEKKPFVPSNVTCYSKLPKIGVNKSDRIPVSPRTNPLSFSSQQNLVSGPLQQPKPEKAGNIEICKGQLQQSNKLTEVQRSVSSLWPSQDPTCRHMQKEQPAEVKLPQTKLRSLLKKPSYVPVPNALPVAISGGNGTTIIERRTCNTDNVNNNLLPNLEKCLCTPALDALWKGSFNIQAIIDIRN